MGRRGESVTTNGGIPQRPAQSQTAEGLCQSGGGGKEAKKGTKGPQHRK